MPFNINKNQVTEFYGQWVNVLVLMYFCEDLKHKELTVQDVRTAIQKRAAAIYLPKLTRDTRLPSDTYILKPDEQPYSHYWDNISDVLQNRNVFDVQGGNGSGSQTKINSSLDAQNLMKLQNSARGLLALLKDTKQERTRFDRAMLERRFNWV